MFLRRLHSWSPGLYSLAAMFREQMCTGENAAARSHRLRTRPPLKISARLDFLTKTFETASVVAPFLVEEPPEGRFRECFHVHTDGSVDPLATFLHFEFTG